MSKSLQCEIEEIIKAFELPETEAEDRARESAVTLWLPDDYKIKFDVLQGKSRRRFSKLARVSLMQIIDKVYEEPA
jgi:hypothetical protein